MGNKLPTGVMSVLTISQPPFFLRGITAVRVANERYEMVVAAAVTRTICIFAYGWDLHVCRATEREFYIQSEY